LSKAFKIITIVLLLLSFLFGGLIAFKMYAKENVTFSIDKPVVYLYGYDGPVNVSIDMAESSSLTVSYPEYKNGWCINACPDGTLTDNNRTYPYLYYEAVTNHQFDVSEGFCVARDDLVDFLEEKLSLLGLTDTEQTDFITYWMPQLSKKDYAVISFVSKEYDNLVDLNVSPKPDSMIRVYMIGYGSDSFVDIPEQHIDSVDRSVSGTTVVEWGGTLLSD